MHTVHVAFFKTIRVPNRLDLDQTGCSVDPDLGPYGLQRLSAVDKIRLWQGSVNSLPPG